MDLMSAEGGRSQKRTGWKLVAFSAASFVILLGTLHGCATTRGGTDPNIVPNPPRTPPSDEPLPVACEEVRHVRDLFADLGLQAMVAYGRLDAGLYAVVSPLQPGDSERIEVAGNAPLRGDSAQFERALRGLNADEFARGVLADRIRNNADPEAQFAIDVRQEDPDRALVPDEIAAGRSLSGEFWTWQAADSTPSLEQWQALLRLYNYTLPEECPLGPAFYLDAGGTARAPAADKAFLGMMQGQNARGGRTFARTDCGGSSSCSGCGSHHDYVDAGGGVFCCGDLC